MKIVDTHACSGCPLELQEALSALLTPSEASRGELEDLRSQVARMRFVMLNWLHGLNPTIEELNKLAGEERFKANAFRTIIAGSRENLSYKHVKHAIENCGWEITTALCGAASGVDAFGERWAKRNNVPIEYYPADWRTHKRGAGYIRNAEMANRAEALIAVWDGKSPGTKSMIRIAQKAGLKVYVYKPLPELPL